MPVIAVATGNFTVKDLQAERPEWCLAIFPRCAARAHYLGGLKIGHNALKLRSALGGGVLGQNAFPGAPAQSQAVLVWQVAQDLGLPVQRNGQSRISSPGRKNVSKPGPVIGQDGVRLRKRPQIAASRAKNLQTTMSARVKFSVKREEL